MQSELSTEWGSSSEPSDQAATVDCRLCARLQVLGAPECVILHRRLEAETHYTDGKGPEGGGLAEVRQGVAEPRV